MKVYVAVYENGYNRSAADEPTAEIISVHFDKNEALYALQLFMAEREMTHMEWARDSETWWDTNETVELLYVKEAELK